MATDPFRDLTEVGVVVAELRKIGIEPILIGGMALVFLGSSRVTRDFDFVVEHPADRLDAMVTLLYRHQLELASRLDDQGEVIATIDNPRVASIRLRIDRPSSCYFANIDTGLRIDFLFDFPIPAATLSAKARRVKIRSQVFRIASEADLLHLKRIAKAQRSSPRDDQDIAFLETRLKSAK